VIPIIRDWYRRHFQNPEVGILAILILFGVAIILLLGDFLAPFIAAVVIAYLLDGFVEQLNQWGVVRGVAVIVVFVGFLALFLFAFFAVLPLLIQQSTQFVREIPNLISRGQEALMTLPERYPNFVSEDMVVELLASIRREAAGLGQHVLSVSLGSAVNLLTFVVYVILVPIMVFFFLKDRDVILQWIGGFIPRERALSERVWEEVNAKSASYVRGKVIEILIVWSASYITFTLMGLPYAMLLGLFVGLSVIIPYVGAIVVTLPVVLVGYLEWGPSYQLLYLLIAYAIIQFIDGNLLVPLLFSEIVNLHPVAIIVAVLFFGEIWGIWGVFFAIPLATLVHAVIRAWPQAANGEAAATEPAEVTGPVDGDQRSE